MANIRYKNELRPLTLDITNAAKPNKKQFISKTVAANSKISLLAFKSITDAFDINYGVFA